MKLPPLMDNPFFGPALILAAFAWLVWIPRKPEVQPIIYGPNGIAYERPKHPVVILAGLAIVSSLLLALLIWLYLRRPIDAPTPTAKPPRLVTLVSTRFYMSGLPISVEPNSTAYVLQLNPNISEGLWEVHNENPAVKVWPSDVAKGIIDMIYVCELTNHADRAFLSVTVRFNTAFFEAKNTGDKLKNTVTKDGKSRVSMPVVSDRNAITFHDKEGNVKTNGQIFKSFYHPIVIPVIGPRQKIKIYLINQSRFIAGVDIPKTAAALLVDGEKIDISLNRPRVNVLDKIPWILIAPPNYHWRGVPDAP